MYICKLASLLLVQSLHYTKCSTMFNYCNSVCEELTSTQVISSLFQIAAVSVFSTPYMTEVDSLDVFRQICFLEDRVELLLVDDSIWFRASA